MEVLKNAQSFLSPRGNYCPEQRQSNDMYQSMIGLLMDEVHTGFAAALVLVAEQLDTSVQYEITIQSIAKT
jgi:hypothetical protein